MFDVVCGQKYINTNIIYYNINAYVKLMVAEHTRSNNSVTLHPILSTQITSINNIFNFWSVAAYYFISVHLVIVPRIIVQP